eukprot:1250707-Alexandrium_andersonii.AAC.1
MPSRERCCESASGPKAARTTDRPPQRAVNISSLLLSSLRTTVRVCAAECAFLEFVERQTQTSRSSRFAARAGTSRCLGGSALPFPEFR